MPELDDIPQGVPGRVAVCELCGHYFNNFQVTGDMKWCPKCSKPSLRSNCPKCEADIPVPPQLKCYSCGSWLTIYPMVQLQDGTIIPADVQEPDAKVRKQLESKGNHWQDVIKGRAEGPTLAVPEAQRAKAPGGWEPKDFNEFLSRTLLQHGLAKPAVEPDVWFCNKCKLPQIFWNTENPTCVVCGGPVVLDRGQGIDNGQPLG